MSRHPDADAVLDATALDQALQTMPHWRLHDGHLRRHYRTAGWKSTMMVVGTIGHLAEAAWHHPDLSVTYAEVIVKLVTHSAGGITAKDVALARQIEAVIGWQPGRDPDSPLEGTPDDPRLRHLKYD